MRDLFGARRASEIDRIARGVVQRVALRQMTAAQADALRQWCQADPGMARPSRESASAVAGAWRRRR